MGGDPAHREEEALPILVLLVFAGDEGDDLFVAIGVEVENWDVHGETVDGSAHDLDYIQPGVPLR